jgi:hypothetical protein
MIIRMVSEIGEMAVESSGNLNFLTFFSFD